MIDESKFISELIYDAKQKYQVGTKVKMMIRNVKEKSRERVNDVVKEVKGTVCAVTDEFMVVQFEHYRESYMWKDVVQMKIK